MGTEIVTTVELMRVARYYGLRLKRSSSPRGMYVDTPCGVRVLAPSDQMGYTSRIIMTDDGPVCVREVL